MNNQIMHVEQPSRVGGVRGIARVQKEDRPSQYQDSVQLLDMKLRKEDRFGVRGVDGHSKP